MPWSVVDGLEPVPSGLYEVSWGGAWRAGRLDLVVHDGPFIDCGTPADYLAANLAWSGGDPVVGEGAEIGAGAVLERAVVWPGSVVAPGEHLVDAIRADHLTVHVA
jgi:mannose-1-phosphate guanylyltransferase/MurNAc alpha-1-phosphate uridylyltransferase